MGVRSSDGRAVLTPNPTAGFVTKFSVDLSQVRYTQLLGLDVTGVALRKTVPDAPEICTGCFFMTNGSRATLAFNVSTKGSGSTFTFNDGNLTQPVRFASASISQISVTGSFATFSGEGALNGKAGYAFTVSATDGGGAGSGLDTVLIQISGPNNSTYNAPAAIAGGDVVVHP